ncbi:MAG: PQQ-binding-like beta-propeller repeat protein [Phycisphaerales bacterium]|nr:MAG: PQQ-binding-like beta-propeller repeat protein [Phycisphaerales bacterium]
MAFRNSCFAALIGVTATLVCSRTMASPPNWPRFRGAHARGIAESDNVPVKWDAEKGENIKWKTAIPGLGHSSPIVWGDRVFVTSAVSDDPDPVLHTGLLSDASDYLEDVIHHYRVYCIDKNTGKIVWEKTAHSGVPHNRRHRKSTHANSTPATDGKHVIAFFGSEGLYCYDFSGRQIWKQNLGVLSAAPGYAPTTQWGFASSPIIHENLVIVQCDVSEQSFLAAYNVTDGTRVWHTPRDEGGTWSTPTVHAADGRTQVIVNGTNHAGGYDATTGEELWRLTSTCIIPIPTPFVADGLVFITGAAVGNPIYVVRVDARGDVSLKEGEQTNESIVWSNLSRGSYIPTPIVYGDYFYVVNHRGILTAYRAASGERLFHKRVTGSRAAFSSSPVAAGGRLYFTSEEGDIHVIKAGPEYEVLAANRMGEPCLATPAITDGMIFIRTTKHLFAIGE